MRDLDLEQLRAAADETTPDAVEQAIAHLVNVLVNEYSHTSETASALDVCIGNLRHAHRAERARHAEEAAALRAQLRRLEGLIGSDAVRRINDLEIQLCTVRDQLDDAHIERDSLRSLLPDVRACAEWMRDELIEGHELQTLGCRILAALETQP